MQGIKPIQMTASHIGNPLGGFLKTLTRMKDLQVENERQRQEIEQLRQEIVRLRELEFENQRLRVLLDYQEDNPNYEFLPVSVIGRDPSNLMQRIIINKGTEDGVREGMVVVANGGLAGRIIKSYATSARVLLITDPSSSINAMVQSSRALGVVSGKPGNTLMMEFVSQNEEVAMSDLVLTSGMGGGLPKGLVIGRVVEIKGDDMDLFRELKLEPAVQFDRVESVFVITNFMPTKLG
jgi:rod shape-determining protein MreC